MNWPSLLFLLALKLLLLLLQNLLAIGLQISKVIIEGSIYKVPG